MTSRLPALGAQPYDVLVIGGGIVGAAAARDAALRGLRVLLVEQGDFGSGTSSQTSKLIHGGLRYLEQAKFRLVFEASRERRLLNRLAPHLVTPRTFLTPVYRGAARGRTLLHAGLTLYDALAMFRNNRRHRCVGARRVLALEPVVSPEGLRGGALFGDSQMHDARLVLENILDACAHGAVCENYIAVQALTRDGNRLTGAVLRDVWSGESVNVQARVVVNTTGPWSDVIRRLSDPDCAARVRPSRGIHLVVPSLGLQHLLLIACAGDRRVIFVQPWAQQTLIGTTDTEQPAGAPLAASAAEVDYLLREVNRVISPRALTRADVVATFAGLRPLVAASGTLAQVSREHALEVDRYGLISLLGGKFTTYRALAEQVVNVACRTLACTAPCRTHQLPLYGGLVPDVEQFIAAHAGELLRDGLTREAALHLVRTYGVRSEQLFAWLREDRRLWPTLCPHHPHLAVEARYAFAVERAQTVSDFLLRRTWMAYSPCHGRDALPRLEAVARQYLPALAARFNDDVRAYEATLATMTAFQSTPAA